MYDVYMMMAISLMLNTAGTELGTCTFFCLSADAKVPYPFLASLLMINAPTVVEGSPQMLNQS